MSWQEWAVAAIMALCVLWVVRHVWRFFRSSQADDNPCAHCASGCDLKRMLDEKQQACSKNHKKGNKNCCG